MKIKLPTDSDQAAGAVPSVASGREGPIHRVAAVSPVEQLRSSTLSYRELLQRSVQRLEEFVRESGRELEFQVREDDGDVVIIVRQSNSGEVLRTIPAEEALRLARQLEQGRGALLSALA